MLDSLRFLGEFAGLAAVIFVAELCLPLLLFVMMYLRLCWEIEQAQAKRTALAVSPGDDPTPTLRRKSARKPATSRS